VERKLSHLEGVMDVMSVRALGLTSVLFDGSVVGPAAIVDEIRGAGFGANAVR
jgi:copper chaperone CopZ